MALKKIVKNGNRGFESYSIDSSVRTSDAFDALVENLSDYCEFKKDPRIDKKVVGHEAICFYGKVEDTDGNYADIEVRKSYFEGGALSGLELDIEYDPKLSDEDLGIVRRAITASGLEKIEA